MAYRKKYVRSKIIGLTFFGVFSLPYMLYSIWIIRTDPLFAIWNKQNITASSSILDYVLTISPGIFLAGYWIFQAKHNGNQVNRLLVTWTIVSITLSLLPFTLQRRFLLGVHLPITLLGALTVDNLMQSRIRIGNILKIGWIGFVLPTNLILLTMCIFGIQTRNPSLFLTQDEVSGFNWLKENAENSANVLTGPETSLYIPAYTGLGVVYGHPYETPEAEENKSAVLDCLMNGHMTTCDTIIQTQSINYIMIGPRELASGWEPPTFTYPVVYESGRLIIYEVD